MTLITKVVPKIYSPRRFNKVAVFGDSSIATPHMRMIAKSLVNNIDSSKKVYTVVGDVLGRLVRKECKRAGIKTFNRKPGDSEDRDSLIVGRLAWDVETFICVFNPDSRSPKESLALIAVEVASRMPNLINCKCLMYDKQIFN